MQYRSALRPLRVALAVAVLAVAAAAPAWTLHIEGTINDANVVTGVTLRESDLVPLGNTFGFNFHVAPGGFLTGSFFRMGNQLDIESLPGYGLTFAGNVYDYAGDWHATNNVGVQSGPLGTYVGNFDQNANTFFLTVNGVSSVPGPAAAAPFLGAGLAALRRRRVRA